MCGGGVPFGAVAAISYEIYVLHVPLRVQWHRVAQGSSLAMAAALLTLLPATIHRTMRYVPGHL